MIKRIPGILLGCICCTLVFAQKSKESLAIPKLPIDSETKLYSYSQVVAVDSTPKNELFSRALTWANAYYKNPVDVIREKDQAEGKILIKARFKIYNEPDKKGTVTAAGDVMYSLTLLFKDGKYKYEITKLNWQQISYYPIERWKDTEATSFNPVYAYYLKQTDESVKSVIADFKKKIAMVPAVKSKDW